MSRRRRGAASDDPPDDFEDGLLDLPLEPPSADPVEPEEPENLSLFDGAGLEDEEEPVEERAHAARPPVRGEAAEPQPAFAEDEPRRVTFLDRLVAGAADLVLLAGVFAVMLVAIVFLGVTPRLELWPGLAGFLASFSFLYVTLPLAFWGQTPGMAWARLQARDLDDRPLAFSQTAVRWLAGVITVVTAGLPSLVALSGRSLGDVLSGSMTHRLEGDAT